MDNEKENHTELNLFQGIARNNISDDIYDLISEMIIEGKLPPGYRFPNELELCKQMGVGRTTLREAFRTLEAMELITRSKRGTIVNDKPKNEILPFPKVLKTSRFEDKLELRVALEIQVAAIAAERATKDNIKKLELAQEKMEKNINDTSSLSYYDTQFHDELARATSNELFVITLKMIRDAVEFGRLEAFSKDPDIWKRSLKIHRQILNAIKKSDANKAMECMREHMMDVLNIIKTKESNKSVLR